MATNNVSAKFQDYSWFSVRVDQYFSAVQIFSRHHGALKDIAQALPSTDVWNASAPDIPDTLRSFCLTAVNHLNYMRTTGIFADPPHGELSHFADDMVNFGFYTCYCFQWTLFETFVKESVLQLETDGLLPEAGAKLRKLERQTAAFQEMIESGAVFGRSPFRTMLQTGGWNPALDERGYADLERIRNLRNKFIHAVKDPAILPESESGKEHLYTRDMWTLRMFAGNVDQGVRQIREAKNSPQN